MKPEEIVARAIVEADEQNGGPPWDYLMGMGKHVVGPVYDRATAALRALSEAGYRVVPVEPTEAMLVAGVGELPWRYEEVSGEVVNAWRAMLDAAGQK